MGTLSSDKKYTEENPLELVYGTADIVKKLTLEDEEGNVDLHVSAYIPGENNEGGELLPVETDAEWDMIEEVINTFLAEEDEDAE